MIIFKPEVAPSDICSISPYLRIVLSEVEAYALYHGINKGDVTVTSLFSDRDSGIHADKRGADVSVRGDWTPFHCNRVKHYLNKKYGVEWGTKPLDSDVAPRVLVYNRQMPDGTVDHIDHLHLQVRKYITTTFD